MKNAVLILAMLFASTATAGTASTTAKSSIKSGKPYFEATSTITAHATVLSINQSNRHVKLRTEAGDTVKVVVKPEAKNLAQVKAGDVVNVTYTEKLTIHIEPAGTAGVSSEATSSAAKAGQKPTASASAKVQYKATITAINKEMGTATLTGAEGKVFEVTPLHPENLDKVKVGELVVFTYSEAVAASVEKAAASK
jgi:hypothetical protein